MWRVLLLAGILAFPSPAASSFVDGNDLYEWLQGFNKFRTAKDDYPNWQKDAANASKALRYIAGATDTITAFEAACVPKDIELEQLGDIVLLYLKTHPEQHNLNAASLTAAAIGQKFPCPKRQPSM
jgi:hypothetical protein